MTKGISEFNTIQRFFSANAGKRAEAILGIGDDCALVNIPNDKLLAVSMDTSVSGVHFLPDSSAYAVGYKSLAVSLSDLAAMGAEPAFVMLSLTLPQVDTEWLQAFSDGFFRLINDYSLQLVGGDTTHGPLAITTQVFGFLPKQKNILRRDQAKAGDLIYVTGQLGNAGLALRALRHELTLSADDLAIVKQQLDFPKPRVAIGLALRECANSAIDISDGLAADLSHILARSQVGAAVNVDAVPISGILKKSLPAEQALTLALSAGDDYELCFTVAPENCIQLESIFQHEQCAYTCIGVIQEQLGLKLHYTDGKPFTLKQYGYDHFTE